MMRVFRVALGLVVVGLGCIVGTAQAQQHLTPMTQSCLMAAAERHNVLPIELLMILYVEGGTVGKNSRANSDGTYDIGLFQINSLHLKRLAKMGITEQALRNNGCLSAEYAAFYLSERAPRERIAQVQSVDEYFSLLARYHSATPKHNKIYAQKLKNAFYKIGRMGASR